jgi:hypothetical protein
MAGGSVWYKNVVITSTQGVQHKFVWARQHSRTSCNHDKTFDVVVLCCWNDEIHQRGPAMFYGSDKLMVRRILKGSAC